MNTNPKQTSLSDEDKWDILTRPEKLGEILLKQGKLTLIQLEGLILQQEKSGMPLGELILSKGFMSRTDVLAALDWQHRTDQVIIDSLTEMINQQRKSAPGTGER
jgi:hypothetical protein